MAEADSQNGKDNLQELKDTTHTSRDVEKGDKSDKNDSGNSEETKGEQSIEAPATGLDASSTLKAEDGGDSKQTEDQPGTEASAPAELDEPPFSVFTDRQKRLTVMILSFVALISPLSGAIYYPATTQLATDFSVSTSQMQLTITTYQIFQGIAPSFVANYSDIYGRKPAYAICIVIYVGANIGLALQSSYAALLVLRMVQSAGSSATIAMGSGSVADIVTRAQRGKFIAYSALGVTLGPALGPVIGGLLTEYLGWRSIFWFLTIFSVALFAVYFLFAPETARAVVGNGSIPPPRLFMTPFQLREHKRHPPPEALHEAEKARLRAARKRVNPFAALKILGEKEGGVTLGFGSLMYGGYFMVLTTLPIQLTDRFHYNAAQTGLCYLPIFAGSIVSRFTAGRLLDWNFRRHATRLGVEISHKRQQNVDELPIEAARLQVSLPIIYLTAIAVVAYGWTMETRSSLAGIEVALFFLGLFNSGGLAGLNTLVVDTHQDSPATAMAANNLFRCLVSAGATAVAVPLIDRIGIGWTSVFIAGVWLVFSPLLWLVLFRGVKWRKEKKAKMEKAKEKKEKEKKNGVEEV